MAAKGTGLKAAVLATACGLFVAANSANAAIVLDFSNLQNTSVNFNGGAFTFTSDVLNKQFAITDEQGGTGAAVGLEGYISSGGPFTIGTITTVGSVQTAPVSGSGTLHITDTSLPSADLTGTIEWEDITTIGTQGVINLDGVINLTDIAYSGTNADLTALANQGPASDSVSFQFVPAMTLTDLKAATNASTSYSGSIFANNNSGLPEPASVGLLGVAFVGLLARRRPAR